MRGSIGLTPQGMALHLKEVCDRAENEGWELGEALQAEHCTLSQVSPSLLIDMARSRRRTDKVSVGSWPVLREAASGHWALYEARAAKVLRYKNRCL